MLHSFLPRLLYALSSWVLLVGWSTAADTLAARAHAVLHKHCASCHGQDSPGKGGFGYLLDRDRLVARKQVVPGQATESPLYLRMHKGTMPPATRRQPTQKERELVCRWIDAGAHSFSASKPTRSLITEAELRRIILADLQALPSRSRRFTRYFTLSHLHNAGQSARQRDRARQALNKMVNSLSWHPRIQCPQPVDPARTVFRIDLRHYLWKARTWERLALVYPYQLENLSLTDRESSRLTGSTQPRLRGDWFCAVASRPPFYHEFLQLPRTDRSLERQLRVEVLANLRDDNAVRAGFNNSGVATNNRLLERHDAAHGAYWRSYDFSASTERQNIFARPLGPMPGLHGFRHVGGEMIFHLPNGLQGYFLVNAEGQRIDKAPTQVVRDPQRPDRTVVVGLSCITCHVQGIIPKDDQVRAHVAANPRAFSAKTREVIRALYPPVRRMRALMKEDRERFARALQRAGVSREGPEPVLALVRQYEAVVDLSVASAEMGLKPALFRDRLEKSELTRKLGALLARGGTVQRQLFEESFTALAGQLLPDIRSSSGRTTSSADSFQGHEGSVGALAISLDGRKLAAACADQCIHLWDLAKTRQRQRLTGHRGEVRAITFSPDSRQLLSGGSDRTIRLWEVNTGKCLRTLVGHTGAVRALAFTPDGRRAVSAGTDRTLRVWDLTNQDQGEIQECCLAGHGNTITCLAVDTSGRWALTGSLDRTLALWDLKKGKLHRRWRGHTGEVYSVALSPDGQHALSGGSDRVVHLWELASGKSIRSFAGHANSIVAVAFTTDGRRVLSASSQYRTKDRIVRVWNLNTGREQAWVDGKDLARVECVTFFPDRRQVLVSLGEGQLRRLGISGR